MIDLHVHTTVGDRPTTLTLRLATFAELAWTMEGVPPPGEERVWMTQRLLAEVAAVGDEAMTFDLAERLLAEPEALGDFVDGRTRLYTDVRRAGTLVATCPACGTGEVEVSSAFVELGLRADPPALCTDDGVWLPPPAIAGDLSFGSTVGDVPRAAAIRVELPTRRLGLAGGPVTAMALRPLTMQACADLSPPESWMPDDREWWYPQQPAYAGLVRWCAAIEALLPGGGAPTLRAVEALPAVDLAWLDQAVMAAQFTDEPPERPVLPGIVPRGRTAPVQCPRCAASFLPMLDPGA